MSLRRAAVPIPTGVVLFPDLSHLEVRLLDALLHRGIQVDKYIIGPSFRDRHLQCFVDHLQAEMPHVKDAFIACASHLTVNENLQQVARGQSVGYRRAAAAIESLRMSPLRVRSDEDLSMLLIVGMAIVTFTLHHSSSLPVCRHILGVVRAMYDKDASLLERLSGDSAAFLLCLLGTEIEDCAVACELPTIQVRPGTFDHLVDRFIGISAPIFTHFYSICALAEQFKHARQRETANPTLTLNADGRVPNPVEARTTLTVTSDGPVHVHVEPTEHSSLQRTLEAWRPLDLALQRMQHFTEHEAMIMMAQAKVLRLAALIILFRLLHPYGTQDDIPLAMANQILAELDGVLEQTGRTVPFADLAHLVACFELKGHAARRDALEKAQRLIDFSQYCRATQQASLVAFWRARDKENRQDMYWTDVAPCIA